MARLYELKIDCVSTTTCRMHHGAADKIVRDNFLAATSYDVGELGGPKARIWSTRASSHSKSSELTKCIETQANPQ